MQDEVSRLSWTVRHAQGTDGPEDPVLQQLTKSVREICATHFPGQAGYVSAISQLSGSLDGQNTALGRGDFRALVSVQRYSRSEIGEYFEGARRFELRLVATAGSRRVALAERMGEAVARQLRRLGWLLGGSSAVTGLLWAFLILPGWAWVAMIIPAMAIVHTSVRLAQALGEWQGKRIQRAARLTSAQDRRLQADLARWNRLLSALDHQREAVADPIQLPFRSARSLGIPDSGRSSRKTA